MLEPCIKEQIPIIYETHNNIFYHRFRFINNYFKKKLIRASKENIIFKIVFISENLKKFWINQGIESSKTLVLHDGFNSKFFEEKISQKNARKSLRLPQNKKIAVYTGSLFPDREIENIIKLASNLPEVLFVIVGTPRKYVDYFLKIAEDRKIKNVILTGSKPYQEIKNYLYAADILLALWSSKVPTINYCSPLKLFEYMASGKIIVAHRFPTIREVLKHRTNALLVKPNEFADLLEKVKDALKISYPNEISHNARKIAFGKYTWNIRAKAILDNI
jgi:glycosyltransferase involved in cell wall biosynthesis